MINISIYHDKIHYQPGLAYCPILISADRNICPTTVKHSCTPLLYTCFENTAKCQSYNVELSLGRLVALWHYCMIVFACTLKFMNKFDNLQFETELNCGIKHFNRLLASRFTILHTVFLWTPVYVQPPEKYKDIVNSFSINYFWSIYQSRYWVC
jgi:hypothetical protein